MVSTIPNNRKNSKGKTVSDGSPTSTKSKRPKSRVYKRFYTLNRLLLSFCLFVFLLIIIEFAKVAGLMMDVLGIMFAAYVFLFPTKNISPKGWFALRRTSILLSLFLIALVIIFWYPILFPSIDMRIAGVNNCEQTKLQNGRCTVIVEGKDISRLKKGDRLTAYSSQARLVSGKWSETPIALLGVIQVDKSTAITQLLLVHEESARDRGKQLTAGLAVELTSDMTVIDQSYLLPIFGEGYLLDSQRVRLLPGTRVLPGDLLLVLEPQMQGERIIDLLPGETRYRVRQTGKKGVVAKVERVAGNNMPVGTLLQLAPQYRVEEPDMILIKGSVFAMGSNKGENDEKPVESITIQNFYISKTEITNRLYRRFVEDDGYQNPDFWNSEGNDWRQ